MPKTIAQALTLFPKDVSVTAPVEMLRMKDLQGFRHSSVLPGGFGSCSFTIGMSEADYWEWRTNRMLEHLILEEHGGHIIFDGRMQIPELPEAWNGELMFRGYHRNFSDAAAETGDTIAYATTGDLILQDFRDNLMHTDSLQLSTSNAEIEAPGATITVDYTADAFNVWRMITDASKGLLTFGNSSNQKMDLAVWEKRIIHYKARNPSAVTWESFMSSGVKNLPVRVDWEEVANAVTQLYDDAGTIKRTVMAIDSASIAKHIRRERALTSIGPSNVATANAKRDTELEIRKDLEQQTDSLVLTRLFDVNGVEWPLCRFRAGDVLRIPDFVPKTGDLDALTLDAFSTFFIEQTECDHTRGTLTIRPDRSGTSLSGILSRAGVV